MLGIGCQERAEREIAELRKTVSPLLPGPIAASVQEGDGCDSGDGGYLLFSADIATDSNRIVGPFMSRGWRKIDPAHDEVGGKFINGVTLVQSGKDIDLIISRADDDTKIDIYVTYGS
ncbi:hypothetical protein [Nonomuraea wenchangensis]|uniref:hypothetical protein n=1 Tax=Nonomuraea wenchangensis TaxID=568860 RepID=UPI00340A4AFB